MSDLLDEKFGHYKLVKFLGSGTYAHVYLGKHESLESYAAIKILRTRLTSNAEAKFLAEAKKLAKLDHQNIIRIRDYGVERGSSYIVMDYMPEGNLRSRHRSKGPLPLELAVKYVKQVAEALHYVHSEHVIHRDIKPENMLLNKNDQILLCDFGIAVVVPNPTASGTPMEDQTGTISGTIAYMAPEQIRGNPNFASDQYALGVVVYEWLCGELPFHGDNWLVVARQHLNTPPPPLRMKNAALPVLVETVVHRALHKESNQRFEDTMAFANTLEEAAQRHSSSSLQKDALVSVKLMSQVAQGNNASLEALPEPSPKGTPSGLLGQDLGFYGDKTVENSLNAVPIASLPNQPISAPKRLMNSALIGFLPNQSIFSLKQFRFSRRRILAIAGVFLAGAGVEIVPKALSKFSGTKPPSPPHNPPPQRQGSTPLVYSGQSGPITNVAWSSDGAHIVSASSGYTAPSYLDHNAKYFARVWDAATGNPLFSLSHDSAVQDVAWSPPDSSGLSFIASCANNRVFIWTGSDGQKVQTLEYGFDSSGDYTVNGKTDAGQNARNYVKGKSAVVRALTWSPEVGNLQLATVGDSRIMHIWQYENRMDGVEEWTELFQPDMMNSLITAGIEHILDVAWYFDHEKNNILALYAMTTDLRTHVRSMNLNHIPEGLQYVYDGSAYQDENFLGVLSSFLTGNQVPGVLSSASLAFTPPPLSTLYLAYNVEGQAEVQIKQYADPRDTLLILKTDSTQRGIKVAWSHDGNYLAAGPWNGRVAIWRRDAIKPGSTPSPLHLYNPSPNQQIDVTALAWSPMDHRIAAGTSDGEVYVWQGV